MCVLARSWHSHGTWPVVVQVTQFKRQSLQLIGLQVTPIVNDQIVSRGNGSLTNVLADQVKVVIIASSYHLIHNCPWRGIFETSSLQIIIICLKFDFSLLFVKKKTYRFQEDFA